MQKVAHSMEDETKSDRDIEQAKKWLRDNGWKEATTGRQGMYGQPWFKNFPGEPMCKTNEPRPLQVCIQLYDHRKHGNDWFSLEIDIQAEPIKDDGWVKLLAYGFNSVEQVPTQVERLLAGWRAICSIGAESNTVGSK